MTAKKALVPYNDELGPRTTSTRFNQVHVQRELCSQHGLFVNIVVDSVAVDQQEHPAVIRFRAVNASHPGIGKVAVVGDIETAHAPQNVSKGAVTVFLDLVSGDYCDRGGSVGDLLYMSGCGVNRDICQLFQAGFAEVLRLLLRKEICRRKQDYRPNKPQPGFSCPQRLRRNGGMDEPYHAGHKLLWCARSLKPWTRPHMFFRPDSGSALEG